AQPALRLVRAAAHVRTAGVRRDARRRRARIRVAPRASARLSVRPSHRRPVCAGVWKPGRPQSTGHLSSMRRIVIIGPLGAGKSTLAVELGRILEIPVHHLDTLYWGDTWTPPSAAEWDGLLDRLVAGDAWIIDGN